MFRSARKTLVFWNVLVFGTLLLVLGGAAYAFFSSRIYSGVDTELRNQQFRLMQRLQSPDNIYSMSPYLSINAANLISDEYRMLVMDPTGKVPLASSDCTQNFGYPTYGCPSDSFIVTNRGAVGSVVKAARAEVPTPIIVQPPVVTTIADVRNAHFHGQPYRVLTFGVLLNNNLQAVVQLGRQVTGEDQALHEFRVLLFVGGAIGLFLALFGSLFLADRALVPIRQAFSRQRQFTADASHELRTPLALIRANAEMLFRNISPQDGELVGEIIRETDHLNRLVGDLLTLARADAESLKLVTRPLDFRALVVGVNEDLQAIAESRGIRTGLSLNGAVTVQGDETRLRQLLLILLDNALKYTDPGGRVDVAVGKEDGRARLVVSDTGIGIPSDDLPHIFDRFYRVDRAREHESGGTGLGLSIAQWIVQAHHGSITVKSDPGHGARFQVDLPVKESGKGTGS